MLTCVALTWINFFAGGPGAVLVEIAMDLFGVYPPDPQNSASVSPASDCEVFICSEQDCFTIFHRFNGGWREQYILGSAGCQIWPSGGIHFLISCFWTLLHLVGACYIIW
jgi:hypothetical protein